MNIQDALIVVLASADTGGGGGNARGHLFERFIARILERFGYTEPKADHLNVTRDGIELDVSARHRLNDRMALAECKAYSAPVAAKELTSFYGKLVAERLDSEKNIDGFFFAVPRLTANGVEQAAKIQSKDPGFRYLAADGIATMARDSGLLAAIPPELHDDLSSDYAILVTDYGLYSAVKRLDPVARTACEVVVWGAGETPAPVLELVRASEYADGTAVRDRQNPVHRRHAARNIDQDVPVIVEVRGSESDFEYQLPASPQYFVGRRKVLSELESLIAGGPNVIVINAQSGWGKSSLALRLRQSAASTRGHAVIFDSRTASHRNYVTAALRQVALRAAEERLLSLSEPSWGSLASSLETLKQATWSSSSGPLFIFFDQFENVFRDEALTREFRDLALGISEVGQPIVIGFAWKTDLVGWTEGHPYRLRDEIRASATVVNLLPLGPREVDTLLRRLEKSLDAKLSPDLKQRLREYSQGLPWLFKKLAGHVLREVKEGTTQEELISEALNVQSLFEADLAELQPGEREGLLHIAKFAPVPVSEVMDRVPAAVVQSLVDRRLVVQVGERLDTYWDIFRDFLTTGRIPIEDSFILRQGPGAVGRLLKNVLSLGGDAAVSDLSRILHMSDKAVYNLSRELRLLGITKYQPYRVQIVEDVASAENPEIVVRVRAASALKRNRAYSACLRLIEQNDGFVTHTAFARALPTAFPAVAAADKTWDFYARSFAQWFDYAGLLAFENKVITSVDGADHRDIFSLVANAADRSRSVFPIRSPGPAISLLRQLHYGDVSFGSGRMPKYVRDLTILGLVQVRRDKTVKLIFPEVLRENGEVRPEVLRRQIETCIGCSEALAELDKDPDASASKIGAILRDAAGAEWSDAWTDSTGKYLRSWARYAGIPVTRQRTW